MATRSMSAAGSTTTFADATGSNSVFQMVGDLSEGGGSCITLPAATNHDINGNVSLAGGLTLGSGLYAVSGSFLDRRQWRRRRLVPGRQCECRRVRRQRHDCRRWLGRQFQRLCHRRWVQPRDDFGPGFGDLRERRDRRAAVDIGDRRDLLNEGASATTVGGAIYFPNGAMTLSGGASIGAGRANVSKSWLRRSR